MKQINRKITVTGTVQGVGFRPYIYNLACKMKLRGTVCNTGSGVFIEIEGEKDQVEKFTGKLRNKPPRLAQINTCRIQDNSLQGHEKFIISSTGGNATGESVAPPDVATCAECQKEIFDPSNRHYFYPFTNCTNCGPRFTIIKDLPYDRSQTSMSTFPMCKKCEKEYINPADRRFHAQPVACPECGPRAWLADKQGKEINDSWLEKSRQLLTRGEILAIKGLGGFHLACSGKDPGAITKLRERKGRPAKPLAVMCKSLDIIKKYCHVSPAEETLLCSPGAPIVVLEQKPSSSLPPELGPGLNTIGVLLPYTPLHILLMQEAPEVLVMTSGNITGLPLVKNNHRALKELGDTADYFLLHNRDIINRCDDSVTYIVKDKTMFFRRSRGYVPRPITVPAPHQKSVILGTGGDLRNTFCLLKYGQAYLSQHIGALDTVEGKDNFKNSLENFCRLVDAEPGIAAYDLHPGYHGCSLVHSIGYPASIGVQHHHAHMASCMAENGLDEEVTGIILDGTGYGTDGNIWGFEILSGDYKDFCRNFHLEYMPLPGGDSAVLNPWITAVSYLITALGKEKGTQTARDLFPEKAGEITLIDKMIEKKINTPLVSSCGRLFDAVSALLGICTKNTYDGQAPAELSELVPSSFQGPPEPYDFKIENSTIKINLLIKSIADDINNKIPVAKIAKHFHDTIIKIAADAAMYTRNEKGLNKIVLSGGSWHNRYLLTGARKILEKKGFEVYQHEKVPPGDGGISLGQAMIATYSL